MKAVTIKQLSPGCYDIGGTLTFASINRKTAINLSANDNGQIKLNFDQVEASDSAALALIIEWLKSAQSRQLSLQLDKLPEPILALAKLTGVTELLSLEN